MFKKNRNMSTPTYTQKFIAALFTIDKRWKKKKKKPKWKITNVGKMWRNSNPHMMLVGK